jgi:23S rRNA (guanosine2251-2'-O)-methyltransferase
MSTDWRGRGGGGRPKGEGGKKSGWHGKPGGRRPFQPKFDRPFRSSPDLVFGRRPVFEVLQAGKRGLHKLWIATGVGGGIIGDVIRLSKERGVPVEFLSRERMDQMVRGHHQGVVAQVSAIQYLEFEEFLAALPRTLETIVLALDEIQDPQNIGAILRSAGFFGVAGVIVPRWRTAPVGDTAMRTSAGAAEHVPIVRVRNLADAILTAKEAGIMVVGTDGAGEKLGSQKLEGPLMLVMGSEGEGLRRLVKERCDKLIGIPGRTPLGSLNVGAATAIFLFEFFRIRER